MKQCDCVDRIQEGLEQKYGATYASINELNLLDEKTFSTFELGREGKKRPSRKTVIHTFCPFCGKKYK